MPKRNDGNEQDLRIRPSNDAKSLEGNNPFTGAHPENVDPCVEGYGEQVDLPETTDSCGNTIEIETPDGSLTYDWLDASDVCPEGFSPATLDKLYMRLLKNHFSDPDKIMNPTLKDYTYNTDTQLSKIRIVMNTTFDLGDDGKLPALIVKRGRQRMQRVAIDDFGEGGQPSQGLPHFVRFLQGSHRVLCLGPVDGFTEALAFEVFTLFNCVSPVVRKDLPLHDFQVTDLSEIGILDDLGNTLGVAVESVYAYEYGWTLKYITPTLRTLRTQVSVTLDEVNQETSNGTLRT